MCHMVHLVHVTHETNLMGHLVPMTISGLCLRLGIEREGVRGLVGFVLIY